MKTDKVVLFDIDYTLFDTERLRKNLYERLADVLGLTKEEIEEIGQRIYEEITSPTGYFNPEYFVKEMAKRVNREEKKRDIEQTIWDKRNFEGNFYKETEKVLKALSGFCKVGIFSKGYDRFQRAKLTAIAHFLEKEHVHITVSKHSMLPGLLMRYKKSKLYLVDDAIDVLAAAKKLNDHVFVIWVKRGKYAKAQKQTAGFTPDAQVLDLRAVVDIVKAQ